MIDRDESASDLLLSSQTIVSAPSCPSHIRTCGDLPWRYVGDIPSDFSQHCLTVLCRSCSDLSVYRNPRRPLEYVVTCMSIDLVAYRWITDDRLEVVVYWGQCDRCGAVHWAKSGPPFTRHMRYAPVGA